MKKIFFFICALCALTACHNEPDTVGLSKMTVTTYDASITADGKFEILGTEPIYMVERFYDEKGKIGKSIVYDYDEDHGKRKLVRKRVNYRNENGIIYKYEVYSPSDELICECDVDISGYTLTIHYCGDVFYEPIEIDRYDENWRLVEETDRTENGAEWDIYTYKYNKQGRIIEEHSESSSGDKITYAYNYVGKKAYYTITMEGSDVVTNGAITYDNYGNEIFRGEDSEYSESTYSHEYSYNSRGLPTRCNIHYLWKSKIDGDDSTSEYANIEFYSYE